MTLFGVLKWHTQCELPFGGEKATIKCRMEVYHDFKQAMVESKIGRAFEALVLEFDRISEPCILFFNEEKLRESAAF
jgi:hypothetical protein